MDDYVSFELAKKLNEKGFNKYSDRSYTKMGLFNNTETYKYTNEFYCYAPTIYQVLKWLRNEKDIFIGLEYINQEACGCTIIIQKTGGLIAKWNWDKFQYANKNPLTGNTYEQAAIAGIEYCLDNLI